MLSWRRSSPKRSCARLSSMPSTSSRLSTSCPWANTEMDVYDFNPDTSRQMLDALGWVVGADGYREKDGQRLSFRNSTIVGSTTWENIQLLLQQMFKDIGAEMVIDNARTAD